MRHKSYVLTFFCNIQKIYKPLKPPELYTPLDPSFWFTSVHNQDTWFSLQWKVGQIWLTLHQQSCLWKFSDFGVSGLYLQSSICQINPWARPKRPQEVSWDKDPYLQGFRPVSLDKVKCHPFLESALAKQRDQICCICNDRSKVL